MIKFYRTFAECKIENQDIEIAMICSSKQFCTEPDAIKMNIPHIVCDIKDFLPTVELFLYSGFLFEVGDMFLGTRGNVKEINDDAYADLCNAENYHDDKIHVLRSAHMERRGIEWTQGQFVKVERLENYSDHGLWYGSGQQEVKLSVPPATHLTLNGKSYAISDIELALKLIDSVKGEK